MNRVLENAVVIALLVLIVVMINFLIVIKIWSHIPNDNKDLIALYMPILTLRLLDFFACGYFEQYTLKSLKTIECSGSSQWCSLQVFSRKTHFLLGFLNCHTLEHIWISRHSFTQLGIQGYTEMAWLVGNFQLVSTLISTLNFAFSPYH